MKPKIKFSKGFWQCGRKDDGVNFGVALTPERAWRKWFAFTRYKAATLITDAVFFPHARLRRCSMLARDCMGLIEHDRYLLKVDGGAHAKRR